LGNVRAERAIIAVTADLHLRQGNVVAAANLLETSTAPQVLREHERLTRIRLLLAQNRPDAAQGMLQELKPSVERDGRAARLISICVLQALAAHALDNGAAALTLMEKAVRLAAPENYQRLFLDEGDDVGSLLQSLRHIAPNFVTRLLRALSLSIAAPESTSAAAPPLSKQETALTASPSERELGESA